MTDGAPDGAVRPLRRFPAAISAGAMALAWANQENAADGSVVVVDREVAAVGLRGELWTVPAEATLALAVVLRPPLTAEEVDVPWLVGGLAVAEGIERATGAKSFTWWPDSVVDATDRRVSQIKADVRLGPGRVAAAVVTARLDLAALAVGPDRRDDLLEGVLTAFDRCRTELTEGPAGIIAGYERRCALLGRRAKVRLLPKGETRGTARAIDPLGRIEIASATGMVERLMVDMVRSVELA